MNRRILLICSGGGHLVQMERLAPGLSEHGIVMLATTGRSQLHKGFYTETISLPDFNRQSLPATLRGIPVVLKAVLKTRPTHVISTGAAPGLIGIAFARLLGAKTLWIDSIANTRRLSVSGRMALYLANEVWTQWPALAQTSNPKYRGRVI